MKGRSYSVTQGRNYRAASYAQAVRWVQEHHGFTPKTCWIAHCKELVGLPVRSAWNRRGTRRLFPCPLKFQPAIMKAVQSSGTLLPPGPAGAKTFPSCGIGEAHDAFEEER